MNIFPKKTGAQSWLAATVLLILLFIPFTACNQDGVGIFYQISQEQAQKDSKIGEMSVYQVAEANGGQLYALGGRSVYRYNTGNEEWSRISGDNYVYDIVTNTDDTLYATINNDDTSLDEGRLMSFDGSTWSLEASYNTDATLFNADGTFILVKGIGTVDSVGSSADLSVTPDPVNETNVTTLVHDGVSGDASEDFLISPGALYGNVFGTLSELTPSSLAGVSGDYRGLASDGSNNLYLTTSSGQIYSSPDGGDATWTLEDTISSEPVQGSLAVVDIGGTDYLIIGTDDGYYEMEIGVSVALGPTVTADTADPDEFAAKYPDLAASLILKVYPSATADVFYLGTEKGLWRRNAAGSFESL